MSLPCLASVAPAEPKGSLLCHTALAELEAFLGNPSAAREVFAAAVERFPPGDARLLRHWALFEKRQGDLPASAHLFRQSAVANPRDERTWLQWGLLERRRGEAAAALHCFARGVQVSPRNPYLWQASAAAVY